MTGFNLIMLYIRITQNSPPPCQIKVDLNIRFIWHMHAGNTPLGALGHLTFAQYLKMKQPVQISLERCLKQTPSLC